MSEFGPLAALSAGSTAINNVMSEYHADQQMSREKKLMSLQNQYNRSNALSAYQQQVQGMRIAGLNPAMLSGQTPQVAAPVTKGSVSQAENVEFDPATLLLDAQRRNVEADTEMKQAETAKISGVDTENTIADTLLKGASADEKKALTERTSQINAQWIDQNKALEEQGKVMAQKWQSEHWYSKLAPDTRNTIDAMASGEIPLTVGGMDALARTIRTQSDLSDADAKLVKNAFSNAIIDSQFSDKAVFDAIVNDPKIKQSLTQEQTKKLTADIDRLRYRMKDVIDSEIDKLDSETKVNNSDYWMKLKQKLAFEYENMDLSRGEGRYGNYAWRVLENTVSAIVDVVKSVAAAFVGAKIVGKGIATGVESATQSQSQSTTHARTDHMSNEHWSVPPIYGSDGRQVRPGFEYWSNYRSDYSNGAGGIQQMRYK